MTVGVVPQKTIKAAMPCRGVGVHSGARVAMVLHPAPTESGIRFRRTDRGGACVAANWRNVQESPLCTTLTNHEGVSVATVEHLLAAFAGAEIDNAIVELDGPEVPVMDGSAEPFLFLIERAGIVEQDAPRRAIKVLKPVRVADEDCAATVVAPKHDAAVGRRRMQNHGHTCAGMHANATARHGRLDGLLRNNPHSHD